VKDGPVPISDSLESVVRSLRNEPAGAPNTGPAQSARQLGSVFGRWTEAVGEAVAAHVTPIKLDGARLVVEVDDPAWATQLRFLETELKARIHAVTGSVIDAVEVRVKRC
jgi:predicted nucleic acid-binding Zn ribbon protein